MGHLLKENLKIMILVEDEGIYMYVLRLTLEDNVGAGSSAC